MKGIDLNFACCRTEIEQQTQISVSPSHSIPTPSQPVLAPTLQRQACDRVAARVPMFTLSGRTYLRPLTSVVCGRVAARVPMFTLSGRTYLRPLTSVVCGRVAARVPMFTLSGRTYLRPLYPCLPSLDVLTSDRSPLWSVAG